MGWSIGYDSTWGRWIGYGVPAWCDHPDCNEEIDRGLAYVCGNEPYGGDRGCGLYFCPKHQHGGKQLCARCLRRRYGRPFTPKPEHPRWIEHVSTDASWAEWRDENPDKLAKLRGAA